MTFRNHRSLALLMVLGLCPAATAQNRKFRPTPYQLIVERNAFGLLPYVAPAPVMTTAKALPQVILTGLTTITGTKLALLKVELKNAKRSKEESCVLKEGEADGPVRVLNIDMKAGTVKVDNSGEVTQLTFQTNGPKATPQPAQIARRMPNIRYLPRR